MKLHTTPASPYGRIARIVIQEKGLSDRIPVEPAATRKTDSPYYKINPSGRVPYLEFDDGTGLEDSTLIARYLDDLDGAPTLHALEGPDGLAQRRLEATARSMLDGISVWSREFIYRPRELRSDFIIDHEMARAVRLADVFEQQVDSSILSGPLNMAQITLACTLHGRENSPPGFDWRSGRPTLAAWVDHIGQRPSVASTSPTPSP